MRCDGAADGVGWGSSSPSQPGHRLPLFWPCVLEGSRILTLHILWGTSFCPPSATNSIPPSQMQSQGDPRPLKGTTCSRVSKGQWPSDTSQLCPGGPGCGTGADSWHCCQDSTHTLLPTQPLCQQLGGLGNWYRRQKHQELGSPGCCPGPGSVTVSPPQSCPSPERGGSCVSRERKEPWAYQPLFSH